MSKEKRIVISSVLFLLMLFSFSGCDFTTKIISSADAPDKVFSDFISALKAKDFDKADMYLADDATIRPVNETGYSFFDDYVNVSLDYLSCESISTPEITGSSASMNVSIVSFDKGDFISWTKTNISQIEHDYMVDNNLTDIDNNDTKVIDKVLSIAIKEYAGNIKTVSTDVKVDFVFSDNQWKIIGSDELIIAIFGGE